MENTENTTPRKPHKPKKSNKKLWLIIPAILLICMIAVVVAVGYQVLIYEPPTGADAPPPFDTGMLLETTGSEKDNPEDMIPEGDAPVEETEPQELPRSKQKIYNFLFVGQDRIALNTDVIMLVSFNTTKNKVNILQIPRDTYIELPAYSGKINGLYAHFYLTNGYNVKNALRQFADTLEQNLCIKIHNVAHINLDGVRAIVDAVGGVDVNVPSRIESADSVTGKPIVIEAGLQHLDGAAAEVFIRHRSTYLQADIGRVDAQKVFVSALIKKVKSSFNVTTVTKLVDTAFKYTTTDITASDGVFFAKQLLDVNMSEINLMSMIGRGSMSNPDGTGLSFWVMVRKNMREMINLYFNIYDFEITDEIFDKNRVFTSTVRYPHLNNVYIIQDIETKDPYNADGLNDDSIYIPHY